MNQLEPTPDNTPPGGLDWRDGLDALDALLNDCAQHGIDHEAFVRVSAVRDIVSAVRRYEDSTDESIRSALWEDAVVKDEPWTREGQGSSPYIDARLLCECLYDCRDCSLTGDWHVHSDGECPVHPEAQVS